VCPERDRYLISPRPWIQYHTTFPRAPAQKTQPVPARSISLIPRLEARRQHQRYPSVMSAWAHFLEACGFHRKTEDESSTKAPSTKHYEPPHKLKKNRPSPHRSPATSSSTLNSSIPSDKSSDVQVPKDTSHDDEEDQICRTRERDGSIISTWTGESGWLDK